MESTQHDQPTQLSITRRYPVAAEKVWRAWTEPQALSQWFGAMNCSAPAVTSAEIDLRVGGRYRIAFNGGDGEAHLVSGEYLEVEPHSRLVFSWFFQSTPERVSRVSIGLAPVAGGTELHFVHDRFFDAQACANHARGWPPFFDTLGEFLQLQQAEA
jgi:uncharacterized protein YndB with AHSA1/START domain